MKFFRESILLLSIYFVSEIISKLLNLPVPGSIIGMILLFVLLTSNIIKIEKVENLANFFLDHLAFFFIPASVGLMTSFGALKGSILKIVILCILTTIIVLSATALTVEFICKKKSKLENNNDNEYKFNKKEA